VRQWESVKGTVASLAHTAGQHQPLPSLGWDELSQALRHRPRPTPLPLPRWSATAVSVVAHDDPDEGVREAARAEIRRSRVGGPE
jgi:hypothetical protein